ncbi:invasion associated locus B family protein [Parvibaculum sp.]|uniref:invasion associated locus B family protein n=1 Tax=Parvibaculum sp. TaxID=2024848 RepID=UPI00321161B5
MAERPTGKFKDQQTIGLIVFVLLALTVLGIFAANRLSSRSSPEGVASGASASRVPGAGAGASGGAVANGQPQGQAPRWEKTANFGVWELRCRKDAPASAKGCFGILEVKDTKQGKIVLAWVVGRNGRGEIGMTVQTPGGVLLSRGVEISLDQGKPEKLVYESCSQRGCLASAPLTDDFVARAKAAGKSKLAIVGLNGKTTTFAIPMEGFDKLVAGVKGQ